MAAWRCTLELDHERKIVAGEATELRAAIRRGADLRIYTEFRHNEHIDVNSNCNELVLEVAEFGVTYSVSDSWIAGIMSLRQPIELPVGFGPRPSMSFFLYNQDGTQAIARPYLDGISLDSNPGTIGPSTSPAPENMPKYRVLNSSDSGSNAPSQNFVYEFDRYRFCVNDNWEQVLRHDADGNVQSGSLERLVDAFSSGCAIKLGIGQLCSTLGDLPVSQVLSHEVFVHGGSAYYYTDRKLFMIGSHPVVRVQPAIPVGYSSGNWDFGWLMLRTDGHAVYRRCDPYSLRFSDQSMRLGVRWFVR